MTTASVYTRISSDRAGERAGVERQREDCLALATMRGLDVLAVHEDNDLSARSGKRRPGFEALLADVDEGRAGAIVAWSLDRLQRNRRDELRLYELCQARGTVLYLVNGADLDFSTAAGRFVADALGSVARMEVDLKSDRQKRAVQQAVKEGRRIGGRRPFGYEADGMTIRPREAKAVRKAYADLLAGVPLRQIARDWNDAGLTSGQNRRDGSPSSWTGQTVRFVILNPRNAGLRAHRREIVGPARWPALVPEETWRAAVELLRSRPRRGGREARALLTGVGRCGVCGATVHGGGTTRKAHRNYRCSGSTGHVARMAVPVDDYVQAVIVERLSRPDAAELLHDEDRPDVDALREQANALRARQESLAVEFADGILTAAQLRAAAERMAERLEAVETQLAHAGRVDVLGPIVRAEDVQAAWDALSVDRRRAIIDLLAAVTIHPPGRGVRTFRPETVDVRWKVDA